MSTAREKVLKQLEAFGISPKRSLGQNFLVSEGVIDKIVNSAKNFNADQIVEVGPGLGALTSKLIEFSPTLKVIELDKTFAEHWRNKGLEVFEIDALATDWNQVLTGHNNLLVSNLPYQISSRIVVDLSTLPVKLNGMILMFQKEVAERITSKPSTKEYGLLSIIAQSFWNITLVTNAGMQDFYPAPQVGSRVLKFVYKVGSKELLLDESGLFLKLVKAAFSQRRKFLIKNLSSNFSHIDLGAIFEKLKIDPKIRAEAVSVETYLELYKLMK